MPNLIYQYYVGDLSSRTRASTANIKAYAQRIGAEYRFDHNPNISARTLTRRYQIRRNHAAYYESLNMLLDDSFLEYDNILFCDCDVFATDGLAESIFAEIEGRDFGICTELFETKNRATSTSTYINSRTDNRWAQVLKKKWDIDLPRDEDGMLTIYNSGVFVFSRQGLLKARERFLPFDTYIHTLRSSEILPKIFPRGLLPRAYRGMGKFYLLDQNYLHAMMFYAKLDYAEMPNRWNRILHAYGHGVYDEEKFQQYGQKYTSPAYPKGIYDMRVNDANFVHIQIKGSAHFDADTLWCITNRPQEEWKV